MAQRQLIMRADVVKKNAADIEGIIERLMDEIDEKIPSYREGGDPIRVDAGDDFAMASEGEKEVIKARIIKYYKKGKWNVSFFTGTVCEQETFLFS